MRKSCSNAQIWVSLELKINLDDIRGVFNLLLISPDIVLFQRMVITFVLFIGRAPKWSNFYSVWRHICYCLINFICRYSLAEIKCFSSCHMMRTINEAMLCVEVKSTVWHCTSSSAHVHRCGDSILNGVRFLCCTLMWPHFLPHHFWFLTLSDHE